MYKVDNVKALWGHLKDARCMGGVWKAEIPHPLLCRYKQQSQMQTIIDWALRGAEHYL